MGLSKQRQAQINKQIENRRNRLKKPPERRFPTTAVSQYGKSLVRLYSKAQATILSRIDEIPQMERADSGYRLDGDLFDSLERIFRLIKAEFFGERLKPDEDPSLKNFSRKIEREVINPTAEIVNKFSLGAFTREYNAVLGVDPLKQEPWLRDQMDAFTRQNVAKIKSDMSKYFDDIEQLVINGVRKGTSQKDIAHSIRGFTKTTQKRARLIARDQVAKLNSGIEEQRAKHNGITKYIWHTNRDGRERPDHLALDGNEYSWDKPPVTVRNGKRSGERNHPGQDIQCRCYAENIYTTLAKP